jgi:hypothetical protein
MKPAKTTYLMQVTYKALSHNVLSSTPRQERDSNFTTLFMIGTDCIGGCTYHDHDVPMSR